MLVIRGLALAHGQPIRETWPLYVHPLRRYERREKTWKIGCFGV